MDRLLYKMPCQSVSKEFKNKEIYEQLFDKRVDKRYLESSVQRFINLNKDLFKFIGVEVDLRGTDNDLTLTFITSNYIGAIPVKMPYDGIARKDFQVIPRFDNGKDVYAELTQMLSRLEHSIKPEYCDTEILCLPMQLKPPFYYEAIKYIELFEKAYNYLWVKFDTLNTYHPYPKSSTNWTKYAESSYNPQNIFRFPAHDSVLTVNHREWQELKYAFEVAKEQVINSTVPISIRSQYETRIAKISNNVSNIKSLPTEKIQVRSVDPQCVLAAKNQANIILGKSSNNCAAWRMDIAKLFERYVQHIVEMSIRGLSETVILNGKISGRGNIPSWGLRYLEPDIMVKIGSHVYIADAKYKANFYAPDLRSDILKDTHRTDLHQLLAYCSFEPQLDKVGILFYPSQHTHYRDISYSDRIGGINNRIILCGLPFGVDEMSDAISKIKDLFQNSILSN